MANADKPAGFRVGYTKHGGPAALNRYWASGTGAIYKGDLVTTASGDAGKVMTCTASTDIPTGIASHYSAGTSTSMEVLVYDDLKNTIFIGQVSTTEISGSSLCHAYYDTIVGVSTTTQQSIHEINGAGSSNDVIYAIDKVDRPDNAWGQYVDLYVEFVVDPRAHSLTVASS